MALKTENQIERDFYTMLKGSRLVKEVNGSLLRDDERGENAKTEDVVVKFLSGMDDQIQTGIVILNCYVPDKMSAKHNRMVKDRKRIGEIEELINEFIHDNENTEFRLETDGTPNALHIEEINQHYVYARIRFYRLS